MKKLPNHKVGDVCFIFNSGVLKSHITALWDGVPEVGVKVTREVAQEWSREVEREWVCVSQSCLTLCNPTNCSPAGFSQEWSWEAERGRERECVLVTQTCLTLCDSMACSPPGLCPWDSPGNNTGVGCHFLVQGIFPTQGLNPCLLCLPHCRQIPYCLCHQGSANEGNKDSESWGNEGGGRAVWHSLPWQSQPVFLWSMLEEWSEAGSGETPTPVDPVVRGLWEKRAGETAPREATPSDEPDLCSRPFTHQVTQRSNSDGLINL